MWLHYDQGGSQLLEQWHNVWDHIVAKKPVAIMGWQVEQSKTCQSCDLRDTKTFRAGNENGVETVESEGN